MTLENIVQSLEIMLDRADTLFEVGDVVLANNDIGGRVTRLVHAVEAKGQARGARRALAIASMVMSAVVRETIVPLGGTVYLDLRERQALHAKPMRLLLFVGGPVSD
jgi:hypothetical protein